MITYDSDEKEFENFESCKFFTCKICNYSINNKDTRAIERHIDNCEKNKMICNNKEIKDDINKYETKDKKDKNKSVSKYADIDKNLSKDKEMMNNTISYKLFEKNNIKRIEDTYKENNSENEDFDFYSLISFEGNNGSNQNYYILNKKDLIGESNISSKSDIDISLSYIEEADLSNKKIKLLISKKNVDLSELVSLTILNLSNNLLREVYFLGVIKSLKILNLSNNRIESLVSIEDLVNLENLDVSFNKITIISSLTKLTKLIRLNLQDNTIQYVNCTLNVFKSLRNLIELTIKNNNVRLL